MIQTNKTGRWRKLAACFISAGMGGAAGGINYFLVSAAFNVYSMQRPGSQ